MAKSASLVVACDGFLEIIIVATLIIYLFIYLFIYLLKLYYRGAFQIGACCVMN